MILRSNSFQHRDKQMNIVCPAVICTSDTHILENISTTGHQRKCNATYFCNRNVISESGTTGSSPLLKNGQMLFGGFIQLQFHNSLIRDYNQFQNRQQKPYFLYFCHPLTTTSQHHIQATMNDIHSAFMNLYFIRVLICGPDIMIGEGS